MVNSPDMGKTHPSITESIREWVLEQKMFFIGSAPLSSDGHVNISPKGIDSLRILDEYTIAYLDLTGSGVETIAHLKENERIVIMLCAFEGPPQIVRFHGKGVAYEKGTPEYDAHIHQFTNHPGARAIIVLRASRISTSCGYSVPLYDYKGQRDVLDKWTEAKGEDGLIAYQKKKNQQSIDGLTGLEHRHL